MKDGFLMKHGEIYIFFVKVKEKPVFLILKKSISVVKEYDLKWHYASEHKTKFSCLGGESWKTKSLTSNRQ